MVSREGCDALSGPPACWAHSSLGPVDPFGVPGMKTSAAPTAPNAHIEQPATRARRRDDTCPMTHVTGGTLTFAAASSRRKRARRSGVARRMTRVTGGTLTCAAKPSPRRESS